LYLVGLLKIYQNRGKQKRPKYSTYNIKDSHVDTRHNTGSTVRHLSIRIRFTKGKKHPRVAVVNKRNDPAIVIFICCWTRSELKEQVISSHQGRPQREAGLRSSRTLELCPSPCVLAGGGSRNHPPTLPASLGCALPQVSGAALHIRTFIRSFTSKLTRLTTWRFLQPV